MRGKRVLAGILAAAMAMTYQAAPGYGTAACAAEKEIVSVPSKVTVKAPSTGGKVSNAQAALAAEYEQEAPKDRSASPADFIQKSSGVEVQSVKDSANVTKVGFKGKWLATSSSSNQKFDIYQGSSKGNAFAIRLWLKRDADIPMDGDGEYIIGKLDRQYQLKVARSSEGSFLIASYQGGDDTWKDTRLALTDEATGNDTQLKRWHEVLYYFDGARGRVWLDGSASASSEADNPMSQRNSAVFGIGWNAEKDNGGDGFNGWLADIEMYSATGVFTASASYQNVVQTMTGKTKILDYGAHIVQKECGYTVAATNWYEGTQTTPMAGSAAFKNVNNTMYRLEVLLRPKDGYALSLDTPVRLMNGQTEYDTVKELMADGSLKLTHIFTSSQANVKGELRSCVESEEIQGLVKTANKGANGDPLYTERAWSAFQTEYSEALRLLEDADATGSELLLKKAALERAAQGLFHALAAENCQCRIEMPIFVGNVADGLIDLGAAASASITLSAQAAYGSACYVDGHKGQEPQIVFAIGDVNTAGASVEGNLLYVTGTGEVTVVATAAIGSAEPVSVRKTFRVIGSAVREELCKELEEARQMVKDDTSDKAKQLLDAVAKLDEWAAEAKTEEELESIRLILAEETVVYQGELAGVCGLRSVMERMTDEADKRIGDYIEKRADWSEDYLARLQAARKAAAAYKDESAAFQELWTAFVELKDVLGHPETLSGLARKAALEEAKKLIDAGQKQYPDAAWKAFQDAYEALLAAPKRATAAQMAAWITELKNAQNALAGTRLQKGDTAADAAGKFLCKVLDADQKTVAVVRGLKKKSKSVKLPSKVTLKNETYRVIQVGTKAFAGYKKMTKLTIGANVAKIGRQAFAGCRKLKSVKILGTKIRTIQAKAFQNTSKQMTVAMPKKMKKAKRTALLKKCKKAGMIKTVRMK